MVFFLFGWILLEKETRFVFEAFKHFLGFLFFDFVDGLKVLAFIEEIVFDDVLVFLLLFFYGSDIGIVESLHFLNDGMWSLDSFFAG